MRDTHEHVYRSMCGCLGGDWTLEREMESIKHRTLKVNGIDMHVAEKGEGQVILFIHGFPELWYSWRHQIISLSARGYRAIAFDLRGYGDTEIPTDSTSYSIFHIVGDVIALLDSIGEEKVFVVGHDWGAIIAWNLCLFRPDRVKALVNLSVPFSPRNPLKKPVESMVAVYGENFYINRFQEPGKIESEFVRLPTETIIKKFLTFRDPAPLIVGKNFLLEESSDAEIILPPWISEDDVKYYADKFEKTGFSGGLNYYRAFDLNWELTAAWTKSLIQVPVKFIIGDLDLTYHSFNTQNFIHNGGFKKCVPGLQEVVVMHEVGHFINQEKPHEINDHIFNFFQQF